MRLIIVFILLTAFFLLEASTQTSPLYAASDDRGVRVTVKPADNRRRIALVIGNSKYASSPLKNPANDARAMAATLRRLGFEVEEKTNLGYISLNETVENFGKELRKGGVGLFFYAGHGVQVNGANYLIPVDMDINDENEVRYKAVDAGLVLAKMEHARCDVNIVILDACRDNPFASSFRSASRGLATMDAPSGTFIAYATGPGKVASDGNGKNGLYTSELVKVMDQPGLNVEDVFKRVTRAVREKSGNRQTPWTSSSLEGDFCFVAKLHDLEDERLVREKQRIAEELKKREADERKSREKQRRAELEDIEKQKKAEREKREKAAKLEEQKSMEREREAAKRTREEELRLKAASELEEEQAKSREKQKQADQERVENEMKAEQEKREMAAILEEQQKEMEREREALEGRKEEEQRRKAISEVDGEIPPVEKKVIQKQFIPIPSL